MRFMLHNGNKTFTYSGNAEEYNLRMIKNREGII